MGWGDQEEETFLASYLPEERVRGQHLLDALLTTTSLGTRTFLNSPGLRPATRILTGMWLWKGDKNPETSPCRESPHTH